MGIRLCGAVNWAHSLTHSLTHIMGTQPKLFGHTSTAVMRLSGVGSDSDPSLSRLQGVIWEENDVSWKSCNHNFHRAVIASDAWLGMGLAYSSLGEFPSHATAQTPLTPVAMAPGPWP